MPTIQYTARDLLRGTVVTPAWYRVRIDSIGEEPAKTVEGRTPSTNYPVEATILFEGDTGDTKFTNVPLQWMFNSKAIGYSAGLLQALGVNTEEGKRYELQSVEGREVDVFVENGTWEGRINNRVNHKYRAIRSDVTAIPKSE